MPLLEMLAWEVSCKTDSLEILETELLIYVTGFIKGLEKVRIFQLQCTS